MTFKDKILGIINSSRSGPEKLGIMCVNPLIVNYKQTVKDLKEVRSFVELYIFNRILVKIQSQLETLKRTDISDKLQED